MPFPVHFHMLPNIIMYFGDTNPIVWLEDFHLAYRVGRGTMLFII
jgi:hypothetical protein